MTPKSRPILFSAPMIRAILDGRKSMTRRVVRWPLYSAPIGPARIRRIFIKDDLPKHAQIISERCPYGQPGDLLWVREVWAGPVLIVRGMFLDEKVLYRERDEGWGDYKGNPPQWKSPRFMPRKFSRITLEITAVRVERVQDISVDDSLAEGCPNDVMPGATSIYWFKSIWNSLHAKDGFDWKTNPWTWAISFRRLKP